MKKQKVQEELDEKDDKNEQGFGEYLK